MPTALRARDPRTAARSAVLILGVCGTALAGLTLAQHASVGVDVTSWLGVVGLVSAAAVIAMVVLLIELLIIFKVRVGARRPADARLVAERQAAAARPPKRRDRRTGAAPDAHRARRAH